MPPKSTRENILGTHTHAFFHIFLSIWSMFKTINGGCCVIVLVPFTCITYLNRIYWLGTTSLKKTPYSKLVLFLGPKHLRHMHSTSCFHSLFGEKFEPPTHILWHWLVIQHLVKTYGYFATLPTNDNFPNMHVNHWVILDHLMRNPQNKICCRLSNRLIFVKCASKHYDFNFKSTPWVLLIPPLLSLVDYFDKVSQSPHVLIWYNISITSLETLLYAESSIILLFKCTRDWTYL